MTASGRKRGFQGFSWSLNDAAASDLVDDDDDDDCNPAAAAAAAATRRVAEQVAHSTGDRVVPDSSSFVVGKSSTTVGEQLNRSVVMGRGKIEIKRIENPTSRQVTFSKRRGGLMKKGHELSVLCDADVAIIIFSSAGKMFEFASSGTSMRDMLERYSKCPDASGSAGGNCDFMGRELMRLRQQVEKLQESQRHMQGEDLQVLSIPDLLNLEQQLDTGASRVRARKNQLLLEEVEELRRKEKAFLSANEDLRQKLADMKRMPEGGASAPGAVTSGGQASQLVAGAIPGTQYEAGGSSSQQAAANLYQAAPGHPNLRDPQTSQTSLHLGLFPESLMPSSSRRTSQHSPTEQGESSMRWEHFRSQK